MREPSEILSNAMALAATLAIFAGVFLYPPNILTPEDSAPASEVSIAMEDAPAEEPTPPKDENIPPMAEPTPEPPPPETPPPPPPPPPPADDMSDLPPPPPTPTPTPTPAVVPTPLLTPTVKPVPPKPTPSPVRTLVPTPVKTQAPKPRPTAVRPNASEESGNAPAKAAAARPSRASSGNPGAFRGCLQAHARYPTSKEARLENPRGSVGVSVSISGGEITGVAVISSSGSQVLDAAARSSVLSSGCGGLAGGASSLTGQIRF